MSRRNSLIADCFAGSVFRQASRNKAARHNRKATAVVELAVLLPVLVLLFLITVDFARVFYFSLTLTNCARAGAMYASDPAGMPESPFANVQAAALADATNLSPQPAISSTSGVDASGQAYAECTASYTFATITSFPLIPTNLKLTRTIRMFVAPSIPDTK